MNAVLDSNGALEWQSTTRPELKKNSVRIKVAATAINRADLVQRAGHYPPPPGVTQILGLECSGTVSEVAEGVEWPKVGDRVCALLPGGGYAEEVVVIASHCLPIPQGVDLVRAAAIPEVYTTAWLNLRLEGELAPEERVLVHAGASGVGTAATQLCSVWGNPIAVTVGSKEKCERAIQLGASEAINRHEGPWYETIKATGKFDLILDPVGGRYLGWNIRSLKPRGRLINIGLMGGREGNLPLGLLLTRRLQIKGSVLRSRSDEEKTKIIAGLRQEVWPLFEQGKLKPVIHQMFPIEAAEEAHELVKSNATVGKVILEVGI